MTTKIRIWWILPVSILALVFVACSPAFMPFSEGDLEGPVAKNIVDSAHGGDNEHFYFLPPMVRLPEYTGTFDGSLSPVVTITPLGVTFTMDTGPGSETIRVVPEEEHYIVNWHAKDFDLDETVDYQITVSVDGMDLGFADVDVVNSGNELKNVDTGEYIPLKDGRTLPIKFRIEEGAIAPPEPYLIPTAGIAGLPFTITDPVGRMLSTDVCLFYLSGTDPQSGASVSDVVVSPDGTTLSGTVPATLNAGPHFISVRPSLVDPSRFGDLPFEVTL